ncbi:MAG: hypothetical protein ABC585_03330 [Candidatus Methanosuratincola petrocarbonis]
MVKLLGLVLSRTSLALRLVLGLLLGAAGFLIFYFLPANLVELASAAVGEEIPPAVAGLLSSLVDPYLPAVGLALAATIFLCTLLRGTKAYGFVTVALSLLYAVYVVLWFHSGTVSIAVPEALLGGDLPFGISLSIRVEMPLLMGLYLVPAALGIAKGALLVLMPSLKKD